MARVRLTAVQRMHMFHAATAASAAARGASAAAHGKTGDLERIVDALFEALATLGVAFPQHPTWRAPDERPTQARVLQ